MTSAKSSAQRAIPCTSRLKRSVIKGVCKERVQQTASKCRSTVPMADGTANQEALERQKLMSWRQRGSMIPPGRDVDHLPQEAIGPAREGGSKDSRG